jgi:SAM-dependent methyltransferase
MPHMTNESPENESHEIWSIAQMSPDELSRSLLSIARSRVWSRFLFWRNKLGMPQGFRSIETGCGYGKFSMLLGMNAADITLLDFNAQTLESAKAAHAMLGLNPESVHASLLEIPTDLNGSFDLVCSFGTLEHFKGADRRIVFENCAKLLRPGGLLYFTVPNRFAIFYQMAFGLRVRLGHLGKNFVEIPYTRKELINIAKSSGVEPLQVECVAGFVEDFNYWILGNIRGLIRKLSGGKPPAETEAIPLDGIKTHVSQLQPPKPVGILGKHFSHILLFVGRKTV